METFKKNIILCIEEAENVLRQRRNGQMGDGTEEEIKDIIIPELRELLMLIEKKQLPEKKQRYLYSFACAFTIWGWNIRKPSRLFSLLREINEMYRNIKDS